MIAVFQAMVKRKPRKAKGKKMKQMEDLTAADVMSSPVISLGTHTTLADAARMLSENSISGALVNDHRGVAVGVVSLFDIVSTLAGLEHAPGEPGGFYRQGTPRFPEYEEGWGELEDESEGASLSETTVGEIMATRIIMVPAETPLPEVIKTLWMKRLHRIFVTVTMSDEPVGVISTMDVLGILSGARKKVTV